MTPDTQRLRRYRIQSFRLLESAFEQMRTGRWSRSEDLLWGSLTLAVKAVALSRGERLEDQEAVRAYVAQLAQERRDRRIRDAFGQLSSFADTVERLRDSRGRMDRLFPVLDDVASAVERLWEMVPAEEVEIAPANDEEMVPTDDEK